MNGVLAQGAPAWAVWIALGLWGAALVALAVAFVLGRRLWRQLKPQLMPYLALLAPAQPKPDPLTVQRAPHKQ